MEEIKASSYFRLTLQEGIQRMSHYADLQLPGRRRRRKLNSKGSANFETCVIAARIYRGSKFQNTFDADQARSFLCKYSAGFEVGGL